jgi:hypothetical protein
MMVILSRDPMLSADSLHMIQNQLRIYFREKNHTNADLSLWFPLLKIWLGVHKMPNGLIINSAPDVHQYFD